jgi:hypothetical protein
VYQNTTLKQYICRAMSTHAGKCVDAYRVFNGPNGTGNAYAKGWLTKSPLLLPQRQGTTGHGRAGLPVRPRAPPVATA